MSGPGAGVLYNPTCQQEGRNWHMNRAKKTLVGQDHRTHVTWKQGVLGMEGCRQGLWWKLGRRVGPSAKQSMYEIVLRKQIICMLI